MKIDTSTTAIVTGGASGLGAATVRALVAAGARVTILDIDEHGGRSLADETGAGFEPVDVTSPEAIAAAFERARQANGQERILVNCAGTAVARKTASRHRETGEIRAHDIDSFRRIIDINLIGTFYCSAVSAAGMMTLEVEGDEVGCIVNTASIAAEDGQIGQVAYAASKAGIVGLTLPMARDLASERIRVNTVLPGVFRTPLVEANPAAVNESLARLIPHPTRFGDPGEFASLVLEICRNAYVNGAVYRLDAGIRMPPK